MTVRATRTSMERPVVAGAPVPMEEFVIRLMDTVPALLDGVGTVASGSAILVGLGRTAHRPAIAISIIR